MLEKLPRAGGTDAGGPPEMGEISDWRRSPARNPAVSTMN
jgi:hypothetical protein